MRSTEEWRKRAKEDPLFAVASHEGKEDRQWDTEEFAELGRRDWADFERRWRDYAPELAGTLLEIGCGAGRITAPLTDAFSLVHAVDVSDDMLALAAKAAPRAVLHAVDGVALPLPADAVDAVFTCHVWQHYERAGQVREQILECMRVLRPGGTVMAHLLLWDNGAQPYWDAIADVRRRAGRIRHSTRSHTTVRRYFASQVRELFEEAGFRDVELREFRVTSNHGIHSFFFARKSR